MAIEWKEGAFGISYAHVSHFLLEIEWTSEGYKTTFAGVRRKPRSGSLDEAKRDAGPWVRLLLRTGLERLDAPPPPEPPTRPYPRKRKDRGG